MTGFPDLFPMTMALMDEEERQAREAPRTLEHFIKLYGSGGEEHPTPEKTILHGFNWSNDAYTLPIPKGFDDVEEWNQAPYRYVWVNPEARATITYCEGDVTIVLLASQEAYDAEIEDARRCYEGNR